MMAVNCIKYRRQNQNALPMAERMSFVIFNSALIGSGKEDCYVNIEAARALFSPMSWRRVRD